jgi:hypothetical protein
MPRRAVLGIGHLHGRARLAEWVIDDPQLRHFFSVTVRVRSKCDAFGAVSVRRSPVVAHEKVIVGTVRAR